MEINIKNESNPNGTTSGFIFPSFFFTYRHDIYNKGKCAWGWKNCSILLCTIHKSNLIWFIIYLKSKKHVKFLLNLKQCAFYIFLTRSIIKRCLMFVKKLSSYITFITSLSFTFIYFHGAFISQENLLMTNDIDNISKTTRATIFLLIKKCHDFSEKEYINFYYFLCKTFVWTFCVFQFYFFYAFILKLF